MAKKDNFFHLYYNKTIICSFPKPDNMTELYGVTVDYLADMKYPKRLFISKTALMGFKEEAE